MITNFKIQKPNLYLDFLHIIGVSYNRIQFEKDGTNYIINSKGDMVVMSRAGPVFTSNIENLSDEVKQEIHNEMEKMY